LARVSSFDSREEAVKGRGGEIGEAGEVGVRGGLRATLVYCT